MRGIDKWLLVRLWLVVGLVAGFLASLVMRGGTYGVMRDMVGIVGALIGGSLSGFLGFGLIGSMGVAFIGACLLIAILHAFSRDKSRAERQQ